MSDTKKTTNLIEQEATAINPRMIVSWKKPEVIFQEVRAQKQVELQAYRKKPADAKYHDIKKLLFMMSGGKPGDKVPDDDKDGLKI
jgi:hypothetical protein